MQEEIDALVAATLAGQAVESANTPKEAAKPQPGEEKAGDPPPPERNEITQDEIDALLAAEREKAKANPTPSAPAQPPQGQPPLGQPAHTPASFPNLSPAASAMTGQLPLDVLADVPLEVSVMLGRTRKNIREILEMLPGSVIELDRMAGEPVDILVNGRPVARGEVVVVGENFGVRVTELLQPGGAQEGR